MLYDKRALENHTISALRCMHVANTVHTALSSLTIQNSQNIFSAFSLNERTAINSKERVS